MWEAAPEAMRAALARHDEVLREAMSDHGGYVFATGGDGYAVAFARAGDAISAALVSQAGLAEEPWPEGAPLRVRMGLHTGEVEERGGDYFGLAVNRAARLMGVGHGGQVLCSEATAALMDGGVAVVDLGEHRLRGLDRPVHVFQLGGGQFPPLRSRDVLPADPWPVSRGARPATSFFGRQAELRLVEERLLGHRLVTLVGIGGAGKTRLGWEASESLGHRFVDGVARADLAAVRDVELVVRSVAQAVGAFDASVDREGDEAIERRLLASLADRNVLLVVDNCEHVITEVSRLCGLIAESCREVRILATSREALGVAGEQRVVVGSLDASAARELFCARAEAVGTTLDVSCDGLVIDAICDRVDCLALAVELAAARTRMMSLCDIERRLDDELRLLVSAERSAVPRQGTMLATLKWSYDLLDRDEQTLFARLGVFSAGWRLDAAEDVCGEQCGTRDVVEVLTRLVDKSLVTVDTVTGRYRLLEPVRQYAWERLLASNDEVGLVRAHRRYYRRFARDVNARILRSGLDGEDWAELANFRAAIQRALELREGTGALGVFVTLGWYWVATGLWREAVEWGRRALRLSAGCDPGLELLGQAMVAGFLAYSGRPREAVPYTDRATELLGSTPEDYAARYLLSTALECLGRSPVEVLEQAEKNASSAGDRAFAAYIASGLARYYMLMWQGQDAIAPLARARRYVDPQTASFANQLTERQLALDALLGRPFEPELLHRVEQGPSGIVFPSDDDRSLALALVGEPNRAVAAIALNTRKIARAGWMQRVMLHLVYAAVARARLGQADEALTLIRAAERTRQELGYAPLPIMTHVGVAHLSAASASLGPSAAARAYERGDALNVSQAVELAGAHIPAQTPIP
jgi:predicted ATPase